MSRIEPSMYTAGNIYREMDVPKYLNTVTYSDRLIDPTKPPIIMRKPRPSGLPERDWKSVIYKEYDDFTTEEYRLESLHPTSNIYAVMDPSFTINGQPWKDRLVRKDWYTNNNLDLRIQLSELIDTAMISLKPSAPPPLLYGKPQKLICLSFATYPSSPIMPMFDHCGCHSIKLNDDIDTTIAPDLANQIMYKIIGLLYTSTEMCTYKSKPLTRNFSNRSNILLRFKSDYIDGEGMSSSYGASMIQSFVEGSSTRTRAGLVVKPPPENNYLMVYWDIEQHVIAGWIVFEYVNDVTPDSYHNNIHKSFNNYLHISAFCGNTPENSTGATTFIAMFMDLCKKYPDPFPGIILDSITNIETLLLYYSLGFRSVLYHENPAIPNSNTTVFVEKEHLMVWNADPTLPYFPSAEYDIHPTTPSVSLDKVRKFDRAGKWTTRFETGVRYLDDIRAFIAIATLGYPLSPVISGVPVADVNYIHQSKLYKQFKQWINDPTKSTIKKFTAPALRVGTVIGGDGKESLVPELYTKPSIIYDQYVSGTLRNPTYRVNDPTFGNTIMDDYSYDADNEYSPTSGNDISPTDDKKTLPLKHKSRRLSIKRTKRRTNRSHKKSRSKK